MLEMFDQASPRTRARITGLVYLMYFGLAITGEVFLQQAGLSTISPNSTDPAAMARDILGHQAALQTGVALGLISVALYVAVTTLFYVIFRPVGRTIALLALTSGLVAMAITAMAAIFELGPLAILQSTSTGLSAAELRAQALLLVQVGAQVSPVSLVFSGVFQVLNGYLMFRSGFLPRVLGVLVAAAGLGWFVFLAPPVANSLLTPLEVLGFLGEVPLMLWLLTMGINSQRWNERATANAAQSLA
jgi:hypothetical protein